MSCCSSSSNSRKSMHEGGGGSSDEFWREYIGGTSLQLFEVIHRAIQLAKTDYPDKFLAERDGIAKNLFSSCHLLENHSKEEEEEVEDGEVVSCFSTKKATTGTTTEEPPSASLSKGGRGAAVAVDRIDETRSTQYRPPTITIRCQVRTSPTNTMRGNQEIKQIPPAPCSSRTQHPRPPQPLILKPKSMHRLPPSHRQPPTAAANPKLVEKKVEATKRKLREAYEEEDRTKRIRRTQLLDLSEATKLLHQNNASTHQLTNKASRSRNNNVNTWATTRRR